MSSSRVSSWLVLGAGYTGGRLAAHLAARGDRVVATRRRLAGEPAPVGVQQLALELDGELPPLEVAGGVAVVLAPPGEPPGQREERLVDALVDCAHLVYVSSTGVYGPGGGRWVDETWPVAPEGALGKARAEAESRLGQAAARRRLPWCALRAAGIYGPGRGLAARARAGAARVIDGGQACVSRIHVDDLVAAIVRAGERGATGPINCADDDPAPHGEVWTAIAARLGLPPPPAVTGASLGEAARAMLLADRKIENRRLREELGLALRYPSWRDALAAELADEARG